MTSTAAGRPQPASNAQQMKIFMDRHIMGYGDIVAKILGIFGDGLNLIVLTHRDMRSQSSSHVYLGALAATEMIHVVAGVIIAVDYATSPAGIFASKNEFFSRYIC